MALEDQELKEGVRSTAVPVREKSPGGIIAAINVTGGITRPDPEENDFNGFAPDETRRAGNLFPLTGLVVFADRFSPTRRWAGALPVFQQ